MVGLATAFRVQVLFKAVTVIARLEVANFCPYGPCWLGAAVYVMSMYRKKRVRRVIRTTTARFCFEVMSAQQRVARVRPCPGSIGQDGPLSRGRVNNRSRSVLAVSAYWRTM